ncbi:MAG: hypothetical protein AVDCRST_MAG56-4064 [uncultured Cytophagales bacterium]|uniref:Uncharacterized protein n=1 Tax=uncultured Cytophagales bacterium TaxID=158755 RepID=A0A6J4JRH4_9SPHI|nr:MAG: hypothetical protein AVDCRST_MAG56-4064 [uncultured Cytophagales bacterium]
MGPAQWRGAGCLAGGSIIGPRPFWFFLGQCQKEQTPLPASSTIHHPIFTTPIQHITTPHQPIRNYPVTTPHNPPLTTLSP